jgi:hypothetical protein
MKVRRRSRFADVAPSSWSMPMSSSGWRLVAFLESLNMEGLDLMREPDTGREVEL